MTFYIVGALNGFWIFKKGNRIGLTEWWCAHVHCPGSDLEQHPDPELSVVERWMYPFVQFRTKVTIFFGLFDSKAEIHSETVSSWLKYLYVIQEVAWMALLDAILDITQFASRAFASLQWLALTSWFSFVCASSSVVAYPGILQASSGWSWRPGFLRYVPVFLVSCYKSFPVVRCTSLRIQQRTWITLKPRTHNLTMNAKAITYAILSPLSM